MIHKAPHHSKKTLSACIEIARGMQVAELVIKNTRFLDVYTGEFLAGDIAISTGLIVGTRETYQGKQEVDGSDVFVVPGFIDAHVHIESSLVTPVRFQQAVLPRGTTTVIWDPHEIANVRGVEGLSWAIEASEGLDLDVFVMLSSCVPSTSSELALETSGAELSANDLVSLRHHPRVLGLAEMMNYPGLLSSTADIMDKLMAFQDGPRDGHCPGLSGRDLNAYGAAGIHSCHESTTLEEAREKLHKGIHVLIREGSCAKDADTLLPLLDDYSSAVIGLCSDDRNPLDIAEEGHISFIVDKALRVGHRPQNIFRAASFAPAQAYGLQDRGVVAPGFLADLCLIRPRDGTTWQSGLQIEGVYKRGERVQVQPLAQFAQNYGQGLSRLAGRNMHLGPCSVEDLRVQAAPGVFQQRIRVIGVREWQLLTDALIDSLPVVNAEVQIDLTRDLLKIAVFERHRDTGRRAVGFVKGFGLQRGALATSINHDSHNAIVVGADEAAMVAALNELRVIDGGIVVVSGTGEKESLPLPVGGLMCDQDPDEVARRLAQLKVLTRDMGCLLQEPFLQLSFLALPVIPSLKITDQGLVDVDRFTRVSPLVSHVA